MYWVASQLYTIRAVPMDIFAVIRLRHGVLHVRCVD